MKKMLLILGLVLVFIALIVGVLLLSRHFSGKSTQEPNATSTNPFGSIPSGTNTSGSGSNTQTSQNKSLPLVLSDGSIAQVPDFRSEPQPSWATSGEYLVAGSPTNTYMITYLAPDHSGGQADIGITLQNEPLGSTRLAAEQALRAKLGLNNQQLCALGVSVIPQPGLSDVYDGQNLGLSFCPGAVKLPQ